MVVKEKAMKKLFIIFSFLFLITSSFVYAKWNCETIDGEQAGVGEWPCLAIDTNDNLHISYYDTANAFRYKRKTGSSWEAYLKPGYNGITRCTNVAVATNGTAYFSFGYDDGTPDHDELWRAEYDGVAWLPAEPGVPAFVQDFSEINSITAGSQGYVHLTYHRNEAVGGGVYYTDSYNSWTVEETIESHATEGTNYGRGPDVAIASDGNVYVSYRKIANEVRCRTKYYTAVAASWVDVGAGAPDMSAYSKGDVTSIAVSEDDNKKPHIAYTNTTNKEVWYAFYDGAMWQNQRVHSNGGNELVSIAVKNYNEPHIAFYDQSDNSIKYAHRTAGSDWVIETVDNSVGDYVPVGMVGKSPSIKLDSNGTPHIAYFSTENNGDLKYAYKKEESFPELAEDKDVIIGNNKFDPDTGSCRIMYNLSRDQEITIKIYDLTGNLVKTLFEMQHRQQGFHGEDEWDGTSIEYHDVSSGIYYIVVEGDGWKKVSKVAIVKGKK